MIKYSNVKSLLFTYNLSQIRHASILIILKELLKINYAYIYVYIKIYLDY